MATISRPWCCRRSRAQHSFREAPSSGSSASVFAAFAAAIYGVVDSVSVCIHWISPTPVDTVASSAVDSCFAQVEKEIHIWCPLNWTDKMSREMSGWVVAVFKSVASDGRVTLSRAPDLEPRRAHVVDRLG